MIEVRVRETAQVMSEEDFRASHPNTSLPAVLDKDTLNALGVDILLEGVQPSRGPYQSVVRNGESQNDFGWFKEYALLDWSQDAIASFEAEKRRESNSSVMQAITELEQKKLRSLTDIALGNGNVASGPEGITPLQRLLGLEDQIKALRLKLL